MKRISQSATRGAFGGDETIFPRDLFGGRRLPRSVVRWWFAALLFGWATVASYADGMKHILIIHSSPSVLPASLIADSAIRHELQAHLPGGVEIFTEFLDTDHFSDAEQEARTATFLREKYARYAVDLVIATGLPALDFLVRRRATLFAEAPLTFAGLSEDTLQARNLGKGVPGVVNRYDIAATVDLALRLQPKTQHLTVVAGASAADKDWEEKARRLLDPYVGRLDIRYLSGLPMPELQRDLSELPPRSIVLYATIYQDGAGRAFVPADAAEKVAQAANCPVYGIFDTFVGRGIVGGRMDSFEATGTSAAQLGLRILAGERPTERPIVPSAYFVDWRQLQRWGLSESDLPPGSIVRFKQPTLWQAYWWQILIVFGLLVVQSILILALLLQGRRRRRAEREATVWRQELMHLTRVATLGELSGAMAHELNQPLTAILSNADAAQLFLARETRDLPEVRDILVDIVSDATRGGEIIRHLRSLFTKTETTIQPLVLNEVVVQVLKLVHSDLVARRVVVTSLLASELPLIRGDRVQLQQVILNLIFNACDAMSENEPGDRRLTLATTSDDDNTARLSVADRGTGIDAEVSDRLFKPFFTTKSRGLGLGLSLCRSIVEAHGGRLWAFNGPERGATFCIALPIFDGVGR